jgi:endo-1,4-beta-D-glucanase Y/4-amino-4-deoxy-L-arabinose transferase-like glycosyltransferase
MLHSVLAPPTAPNTATTAIPHALNSHGHPRSAPRRAQDRRQPIDVGALVAIIAVLAIAGIATGLNMFGSPHYESDEGTYVGSAWSMFEEGKLAYYTYNYDHPPFGWLVIGAWATLVGGFLAFGSSTDTARVLMLLVCLASTLLIFLIVRRATGSVAAAVAGALLFALSPLGIPLHRQVWLDNLATAWLLVAILALLGPTQGLRNVLLSALAFGLSFWTKEVMIVCLPAMLLIVGMRAHGEHRRFALTLWGAIAVSVVSVFVLLALLKDELLPPGVLWSSDVPHVSLLETYRWQMSRAGAGTLLAASSQFRQYFDQWWQTDPALLLGGLGSAVLGLALISKRPLLGGVALLGLTYLLFLGRGGVVLYYYIIPVLAIFAIGIGLLAGYIVHRLRSWHRVLGAAASVLLLVFSGVRSHATFDTLINRGDFTAHPTTAQKTAAAWMMQHLPRNSIILMDSYGWVEMRDASLTGDAPFVNAHYYWPGVSDPRVRDELLHNRWQSVDYVAVSPSVEADMTSRDLPIIPDAIRNADEVRTFYTDDWSIRILRVRKLAEVAAYADPFLTTSWTTYCSRFIHDGQVIDPATGETTSEGQSYALLRAVYADDRATFDQVWDWTRANLRSETGRLAWRWGLSETGQAGVLDPQSAADADQDIALALLFASQRWDEAAYHTDARGLLDVIWETETDIVAGQRVLVGGPWARAGEALPDAVVVNPSYFAPYAYRIFAEVDPSRPWLDLVDSSYNVLDRIHQSEALGGAAGVVPNWVALDATTGELLPADGVHNQASQFSFDASRLPWRLTLDWLWFQDDRARSALAYVSLPARELTATGQLKAAYKLDGQPAAEYEATSMYAGTLPGLLVGAEPALAHTVFATRILRAYENTGAEAYWGDPDNYYDQNWAWFATALMNGGMANVWADETVVSWDRVLP